MTDMGPKIKSLRLAKGLYQQDLARILNVTKGAVGMWETNKRVPDIETIGKIADFFGVSVDWLTGASEYKNPVGVNDYSWGTVGDFEFAVGFVSLLKKIRHSLGVSDFQMGRVIGFNPSQYLAAEDGEIPITRRQAEMLCKKLGTNVSQVLFDNELYDEYVPEEYHNDVRKWEIMKKYDELDRQVAEFYPDWVRGVNPFPNTDRINIKDTQILKKIPCSR